MNVEYYKLTEEVLNNLQKLNNKSRKEAYAKIGSYEFEHISDDPIYWLDASQHVKTKTWPKGLPYVYTKDPHILYLCKHCKMDIFGDKRVFHLKESHNIEGSSIRFLQNNFLELPAVRPFTVLEYMPPIIDYWLKAQYMVIEKSRDMMATWLFVALHTWDVMFHKGRQHIFQSQDSGKTLELIMRAKIIYDNQPAFIKSAIGPISFGKTGSKSGELLIVNQESELLGFPQGPDQIRQFHPSGIFTDETAFQIEAAAAFAAIKPSIQMGGRYTGLSSPNKSFFEKLARDTSDV